MNIFNAVGKQLQNDKSISKVLLLQNLAFVQKEQNKFDLAKLSIQSSLDLLNRVEYQPLSYRKQLLGNSYAALANIQLKENKDADVIGALEKANDNFIYCLENRHLYSKP